MPDAFFYPFHLCSPETLERVLARYDTVHFRDYMALQLTPTSGTTAYPNRMGDSHPEFLKQERIVQGYRVSGPLSPEMDRRIDGDFKDRIWREIFHSPCGMTPAFNGAWRRKAPTSARGCPTGGWNGRSPWRKCVRCRG
jgi:hypothetical protein